MFKRVLFLGLILTALVALAAVSFANEDVLNTSSLDKGIITINIEENSDARVMITKDDEKALFRITESANIPLQMGNGQYLVQVYVKQNFRYQTVASETVTLSLEDENVVFLQSVYNIEWNEEMEAIQVAKALTEGLESDREKLAAIHNYIINTIEYDYAKARTVRGGYVPSTQRTWDEQNGICYDYATLLAAMTRSVGIPTKVTVGHIGSIYHAWNQVYVDGEWITVDSTNDAIYAGYGATITLEKTASAYAVESVY